MTGLPTPDFIEVEDARLYYEDTGLGSPVVMLHGGLLDVRSWDLQVEPLVTSHRVIRVDARFHGRSEGTPGVFSSVEDLRAVLDGLNSDRAEIMGLSLGARTAIDFANTFPERVSALVLVSPGASGYEQQSAAFARHNQEFFRAFGGGLDAAIDYFLGWTVVGPRRQPADVDAALMDSVRSMAQGSLVKQSS